MSWKVVPLRAPNEGHKGTNSAGTAGTAGTDSSHPKPRARSWSEGEGEHPYPRDSDVHASPWSEGKLSRQSRQSRQSEPDSPTPPPVSGVTSSDQDKGEGYSVGPDGLAEIEA